MTVYYNENEPHAAAWLRELIKQGSIADGYVDERSITDVVPGDLDGFDQCHFFAGIGVWSLALRNAGWPDDRPIWTGSCPCQPFSAAGQGAGVDDERHLWPAFYKLIAARQPGIVAGEQVASHHVVGRASGKRKEADGPAWIDAVCHDLEDANYATGFVVFPSCGTGAPHIRDRCYWMAHAGRGRREVALLNKCSSSQETCIREADEHRGGCADGGMAHADHARSQGRIERRDGADERTTGEGRVVVGMADSDGEHGRRNSGAVHRTQEASSGSGRQHGSDADGPANGCEVGRPGPTNGYWREADWLRCTDEKWRPVEPGAFPLVNGAPRRMVRGSDPGTPIDAGSTAEARSMRLRGYGNAVNAKAARIFVEAVMEVTATSQ